MRKKSKIIVAAFLFITVSLAGFYIYKNYFLQDNRQTGSVFPEVSKRGVKPTPFPFEELTIPYLRNQKFDSKLFDLEEINSNNNYTTYLTSYTSSGLKINGLLTIPTSQKPPQGFPAIVFVHGYIPPSIYQTTQNYLSYVDYLARNGFVVFKIDLRGHGNSEGSAGGAYFSSDYVIDTLNAYSSLENAEYVDSTKIGLWGHSMAGNVLFRSMVVKKNIPAVVIWAGAVYTYEDMSEYGIDDNSYRPPSSDSKRREERERLRSIHGNFSAESKFWQQVVPTNFLEGVNGNLQINHAVDDPVVSINYSRNLKQILAESGVNFRLIEYPSGGHNISGNAFNQAMQDTVSFFRENM